MDSGHPTAVVLAVDLVFIVPPMVLTTVWLARRRPLGWVLAGVMSVGGTVYTLTLALLFAGIREPAAHRATVG